MVLQSAAQSPFLAPELGLRSPSQLTRHDVLPVATPLEEVLPEGLRRGATVSVTSTSLMLLLLASPTQAGSWAAVVGFPQLGMVAASELGVSLQRCALVPRVGRHPAKIIATLIDAVDLVVVHHVGTIVSSDARRLIARARERRAVLILSKTSWPEVSPLTLTTTRTQWQGVGDGNGHLRGRWLDVETGGRGAMSRPRQSSMWLGEGEGGIDPGKTVRFHPDARRSAES